MMVPVSEKGEVEIFAWNSVISFPNLLGHFRAATAGRTGACNSLIPVKFTDFF